MSRRLGPLTIGLASAAGLAALLAPLWPAGALGGRAAGPLLSGAVVALCLAAAALEAGVGLGPRAIALLGALVAFNSVLRFVEVVVPGPGEFSPIFAPIIVAGYAFGARFGFLTGALTLAVSALITGGVGPWLPYQMLAAGWVGLSAGWLPGAGRQRGGPAGRRTVVGLAAFGAAWGIAYGIVLTLWDWQFRSIGAAGPPDAAWARFAAFYLATSLPFDAFRAAGNAALVALAAPATLGLFSRLGRPFIGAAGGQARPAEAATGATAAATAADEAAVAGSPPLPAPTAAPAARDAAAHHPRAWLAWLGAALVLGSATRNPLVLAEGWLAIAVVHGAAARGGSGKAWPVGRVAPWIVASTVVYNGLLVHAGQTVLARLPAGWPLVGGAVTLEALIQGLANGLALVVLVAAFAAFESALTARAMLALVPRAFGALALSAAVALTAVPAVRRELAEVREALSLHGRTTGLRGLAAALVPTLMGGLERAVRLAESLAARGLVAAAPPPAAARGAVALGLAAVLAGAVAAVAAPGPVGRAGLAALVAGAVATTAGLRAAGAASRRTTWRPAPWRAADTLVVAAAAAVAALALWPPARAALAYSPYPKAAWPPLDVVATCGTALLALPAWRLARRRREPMAGDVTGDGWRTASGVGAGDGSRAGGGGPATRAGTATVRATATVPPAIADAPPPIAADAFSVRFGDAVRPGADPAALGPLAAVLGGGLTLVAGPSGAGKSTLLRAICGLVPHVGGGVTAGRLRVAGRDPVAAGPAAMGAWAGFVPDAPEQAFALDTVADEVAFGLEERGVSPAVIGAAVAEALAAVGAAALAGRPVDTLSGGEAQRVAVAAALAPGPAVLALDEPTSQLDDAGAAEVLASLRRLADAGVTVVVAEHRLERVAPLADRLLWLPGGGAPARLGRPADVLAGVDRPRPAAPPATVRRDAAGDALAFEAVSFSHGGRPLLRDVALAVAPGELVALMAPSGAGKTTLLRLAAGFLRPQRGRIVVAGRDVAGEPPATIAGRLSFVPQSAGRLLVGATVAEAVARAAAARGGVAGGAAFAAATEAFLARLDVAGLGDRHPLDLSAGERQRVALALALAAGRPAIALDEPTRGLDAGALARLVAVLHGCCASGAGVLVATHDRRLAEGAHRTVVWGEA